jgi:type II secretory ATPase GspE/PulE/Tfp pilus assembly ATPase PilB-like protein
VWFIPTYWVSFPLLVIAYVAPLASYVVYRNSKVLPHDKVLTADHLRFVAAMYLGKLGIKIESERRDPHETGPPVILNSRGGATERDDGANLLAARQCPGFREARQVVADGLDRRADAIMLDCTPEAVGIRFLVDGVWHQGESQERQLGDAVLEALKTLCGLNPQDRLSRQEGKFSAKFNGSNYAATLAAQGTKAGERVMVQFERTTTNFISLDELGMRSRTQEQLRACLAREKGFLLLSAMPANGLRTSTNVILRSCDRFLREFLAVEEEGNRYEEVENIPVHVYKASEGQCPADILPDLFLLEPNVVVVRDLVNGRTVDLLSVESAKHRLLISTVRARDATEAMLRVLALKPAVEKFATSLSAVLNQRLIRKLCDQCKEAYQPAPEVLRQMGIPPDRVQAFYRPPQQPEEVCEHCKGIGYVGRMAIFEWLQVDDTIRRSLLENPRLEALRQTARRSGHHGFQEEGLVLVAKGVTALPELMRVLKQ